MRIGILGNGKVATTIGSILISKGYEVMLSSKNDKNERVLQWVQEYKSKAYQGNYQRAAAFGELLWNCTSGAFSLDVVHSAGIENFTNKILIDVANPLDFSRGIPPFLTLCNTTSLGEELQLLLPECKVVKTLNTIDIEVLKDHSKRKECNQITFLCGDDEESKHRVIDLLVNDFEWEKEKILNLGGIQYSRNTEMLVPFLYTIALKTGSFINSQQSLAHFFKN